MHLHETVIADINAYAGRRPVPRGESPGSVDQPCREWTQGLCETMRARHPHGMSGVPHSQFGHKRAQRGRPESKETLALAVFNGAGEMVALHGWDLLEGVGTGQPRLVTVHGGQPFYHDLFDEDGIKLFGEPQIFIPVAPVDHIGGAGHTAHARLPGKLYAMSAFDLCARLAQGDEGYYVEVVRPSGLVPRVIVASIWSGGPNNRTSRTMPDGRDQVERALPRFLRDGLAVEVTLLCDTQAYADRDGLTRVGALEHLRGCNEILLRYPDAVRAVTIGNENSHSVEASWMTDAGFLREAIDCIDPRFPVAVGAGHGGEPVLVGGSYARHHADRSRSPEENGQIMGAAQRTFGVDVVDGEPLGITEPDRVAGRQRTSDPEYAARLARAAIEHGLGGTTLHLDSGIGCRLEEHGDVHREAMRRFREVLHSDAPPIVVPPPPLSPGGNMNQILDADITNFDVAYDLYVNKGDQVEAIAQAWYTRSRGHAPAGSDLRHGLWRLLEERQRWGTLRRAFENTWPGGAPVVG